MTRTKMALPMTISTCSSSSLTSDSISTSEVSSTSRSEGDKRPRVMVVVPSVSSTDDLSSAANCVSYSCSYQNAARQKEEVEMYWLSPRKHDALNPPSSFEQTALGSPSTLRYCSGPDQNWYPGYELYYDVKTDFTPSTWKEVLECKSMRAFSVAVLATATIVVVHPLVFIAGAATAVWAVGVFHAVEQGYDFFSDGTFSRLFWEDKETNDGNYSDKDSNMTVCNPRIETNAMLQENSFSKIKGDDHVNIDSSIEKNVDNLTAPVVDKFVSDSSIPETERRLETKENNGSTFRDENIGGSSAPPSPCSTPNTAASMKERIRNYFPKLETEVITAVKFPGLHVLDFFSVFFSDEAPYSMKEFQQSMGDIDLSYGKWMPATKEERVTPFLPRSKEHKEDDLLPLPSGISVEQRTITFKSLTKSYFGPAYASATKTQRVTKISREMFIIENYTQLSDIPYSDRFCVCERWVMEAVPNDKPVAKAQTGSEGSPKLLSNQQSHASNVRLPISYTTMLTVDVEVMMLKKCPWEAQIRKKTLPSMEKVITSWCTMATTALEVTEQKKLERMRRKSSQTGDMKMTAKNAADSKRDICSTTPDLVGGALTRKPSTLPTHSTPPAFLSGTDDTYNETKQQRHLMALHQERFRQMEEKIAAGDLEWCSIEVQHSDSSEQGLALTKVLDPYPFCSMGGDRSGGGRGDRSTCTFAAKLRVGESRQDKSEKSNLIEQDDEAEKLVTEALSSLPLQNDNGCNLLIRIKRRSRFNRWSNRSGLSVLKLLPLRRNPNPENLST